MSEHDEVPAISEPKGSPEMTTVHRTAASVSHVPPPLGADPDHVRFGGRQTMLEWA